MRKRQKLQRNVEILQTEFPLMFSEVKSLLSGIPFLIFYSSCGDFVEIIQLAVENAF